MASTLETDVLCAACGYNLRGLDRASRCPECGRQIALTIREARERPEILSQLIIGSLQLGLGTSIFTLSLLVVWFKVELAFAWLPVPVILCAVGSWHLAEPLLRKERWLATPMRVLTVATATLQGAVWILVVGTSMGWGRSIADLDLLMKVLMWTWAAAAMVTFVRTWSLADEIGNRTGVIQARVLGLLVVATLIAAAGSPWRIFPSFRSAIAMMAVVCLAVVWSAVFFIVFSFVLRRRMRRVLQVALST